MILFFALLCVALAIAGATAFVIFWPLTLVHIRDRHPVLRTHFGPAGFASPVALRWLLLRQYREAGDRNLNGLAAPAYLSLLAIIAGLLAAGALWLMNMAMTA